jgi:hypothetical protein
MCIENSTKARYFSTADPRTVAAPITMSDNPGKRSSVLARIIFFSAQIGPLCKCYTLQNVLTFLFTLIEDQEMHQITTLL